MLSLEVTKNILARPIKTESLIPEHYRKGHWLAIYKVENRVDGSKITTGDG